MTLKNTAIALSIAGLGLIAGSGQAQAAALGTQGFADFGLPSVNTGDINTATTFTLGNLLTTPAHTGFYTSVPSSTDIGAVTFSPGIGSSLSFTNSVFGTFISTAITQTSNVTGSVAFVVSGIATGGSGTTPINFGSAPAILNLSFTQTPSGPGGTISDSATLSVVPEPSEVLGTLAFGGIVAGGLLKRKVSSKLA